MKSLQLRTVGQFLQPSVWELVVAGLAIFSWFVYYLAILFVYDRLAVDSLVLTQQEVGQALQRFWHNPYVDMLSTTLFWFGVGVVGLSLLWGLVVMLIDMQNNVTISRHFIHPKSFHNADVWTAAVARIVIRIATIVGGGYFAIRLLLATPQVYEAVRYAAQSVQTTHALHDGLSALFIGMSWLLGLHVITLAFKLRSQAGSTFAE